MRFICNRCGRELPELQTEGDEICSDLTCQECALPALQAAREKAPDLWRTYPALKAPK